MLQAEISSSPYFLDVTQPYTGLKIILGFSDRLHVRSVHLREQ